MDKYPYGEEKPLESLYFGCSGMKNDVKYSLCRDTFKKILSWRYL